MGPAQSQAMGRGPDKGKFVDEIIPWRWPLRRAGRRLSRRTNTRGRTQRPKNWRDCSRSTEADRDGRKRLGHCGWSDGDAFDEEGRGSAERDHPVRRIVTYAPICGEPRESPLLPAIAIRKALSQADLSLEDMKFIEINEALPPCLSSALWPSQSSTGRKRTGSGAGEYQRRSGGDRSSDRSHGRQAPDEHALRIEAERRGLRHGAICGAVGQADAVIVEV